MAWLAGAVAALAMYGLWMLGADVASGLRRLWEWARRDRVTPLLEDDDGRPLRWPASSRIGESREAFWHRVSKGDDLDELPPPLPPERTQEELGFTGEPDIHCNYCTDGCVRCDPRKQDEYRWIPALAEQQERRPPAYETEARAHYVAMGFDYPSGLLARVRELTP